MARWRRPLRSKEDSSKLLLWKEDHPSYYGWRNKKIMRTTLSILLFTLFWPSLYPGGSLLGAETPPELPRLHISGKGRYFMTADGKPFFWLGDTGWLLLTRL